MARRSAKPARIDDRLRVLDAHADRERLWLHKYAAVDQHLEAIARAMAQREHHRIRLDLAAIAQPQPAHMPPAVAARRNLDVGHA